MSENSAGQLDYKDAELVEEEMQLGWKCPGSGINKEPWKRVEGTGICTRRLEGFLEDRLVGQSEAGQQAVAGASEMCA